MASITYRLHQAGLISPPKFIEDNIIYEVVCGSQAYGTNEEGKSDYDIIGVCMPPKEIIFPHLAGEIYGFDTKVARFESFENIGAVLEKKEYDLKIYNIVKFFRMAADCNPFILEALFVPANLILHSTKLGQLIRENRKLFLSKKCWHTLKGYAYSMLHKSLHKKYENSKRKKEVDAFGFSTKSAYHVVRLMSEAEQILTTGDLNLQANREQLKSIRRGEWSIEQIKDFFETKEKVLEDLYINSKTIPDRIQEKEIKELLLKCIEEHYGKVSNFLVNSGKESLVIKKIKTLLEDLD